MPATVQLQFHAEPYELLELAGKWSRNASLQAVIEQFFPSYAVVPVPDRAVEAAAARLGRVDRVCLSVGPLDTSAPSTHEFLARNPDCLALSIGRRTDEGLRESDLSAATSNHRAFKVWTDLAREAKSEMHKGALVRNPASGAEQPVPQHLHTSGAHRLAKGGTRMLAAAGWNEFVFADLL